MFLLWYTATVNALAFHHKQCIDQEDGYIFIYYKETRLSIGQHAIAASDSPLLVYRHCQGNRISPQALSERRIYIYRYIQQGDQA